MSDDQRTAAAETAPTPVEAVSVGEVPDTPTTEAVTPPQVHVNLPTSAFKDIKAKARDKGIKEGQRMANEQIAAAAKAAGFDSVEAAFAALAGTLQAPAAPSPASPAGEAPAAPDLDAIRAETEARVRAEWEAKVAASQAAAEAQRQEYEEALSAKDAEIAIRDSLARAGVADIDYASTLLARELASLDDDALATFDDAAWIDAQRKDRPYLFGGAHRKAPATTGVTEATSAPSPEQVASATAGAGNFDARTAKPQDFAKRLADLGLNVPGYGARA